VAWAPSLGLAPPTLASCSQDGHVFIWTNNGGKWVRARPAAFVCDQTEFLLYWRRVLLEASMLSRHFPFAWL
jgi:hypothetical protein